MKRETIIYKCDVCKEVTEWPWNWFIFYNIHQEEVGHVCCQCFHGGVDDIPPKLTVYLDMLCSIVGGSVEIDFYCTEYKKDSDMGYIKITNIDLEGEPKVNMNAHYKRGGDDES